MVDLIKQFRSLLRVSTILPSIDYKMSGFVYWTIRFQWHIINEPRCVSISFEILLRHMYAVDIARLKTVLRAKRVQRAAKLHDTVNPIIKEEILLFINAFNTIWQDVDYILFKYFDYSSGWYKLITTVQLMTDWIPREQKADVWMFAESNFKLSFIYR